MTTQEQRQSTETKNSITLKGSAELVREFFHFGINSILYQRGLYPADTFRRDKKYSMSLLVTTDEKLLKFFTPLLENVKELLTKKELKRLVVVVSSVQSKEVIERWQFDIASDDEVVEENAGGSSGPVSRQKEEKKIRQEIQDVIRQITASVTFLPLVEEQCSFDVLVYTHKSTAVRDGWEESGACRIASDSVQEVKLRSFSTAVHSVNAKVSYKGEFA